MEHGIFTLDFFCPIKLHSRQTFLLSSVSCAHSYVRMTHTNGGGMQQTFQNANPPLLLLFPFGAQSNGVLFFFPKRACVRSYQFSNPAPRQRQPKHQQQQKKEAPFAPPPFATPQEAHCTQKMGAAGGKNFNLGRGGGGTGKGTFVRYVRSSASLLSCEFSRIAAAASPHLFELRRSVSATEEAPLKRAEKREGGFSHRRKTEKRNNRKQILT